MSSWRLSDGRVLVEGPAEKTSRDFDAPGLGRVTEGRTYYLLTAAGALERVYEGGSGAVQEHFYESAYRVVGTDLVEAFADWCDDHLEAGPRVRVHAVLEGMISSSETDGPRSGAGPA